MIEFLESPDMFYKLHKMTLNEHRGLLQSANKTTAEGQNPEKKHNLPPAYFKRLKVWPLSLFLTIDSDSFFLVDYMLDHSEF